MKKKLFVITLLVMFLLSISVCAFADQRTDNYPKTVYVNVLNLTTGVTRSQTECMLDLHNIVILCIFIWSR